MKTHKNMPWISTISLLASCLRTGVLLSKICIVQAHIQYFQMHPPGCSWVIYTVMEGSTSLEKQSTALLSNVFIMRYGWCINVSNFYPERLVFLIWTHSSHSGVPSKLNCKYCRICKNSRPRAENPCQYLWKCYDMISSLNSLLFSLVFSRDRGWFSCQWWWIKEAPRQRIRDIRVLDIFLENIVVFGKNGQQ
jgi:hypothetical protein